MTETEQLKEDIAILQEKLRKLEEHQMTLENEGEFDMVSYNNEIYFRMEFPTGANWWKRDFRTDTMMLVDSQPLEQYYQDQVVAEREREMIKRNLKTSLQELGTGDVRPIDDVMKEVEKLQEKDWDIKVETDYLTGKARHKTKIVDKDGNDYKPEPLTTEELLKPNWEPKPQEPEEVAEGLSTAFRDAVKQGVVSSVDKPKDDFIDEMVAELKGKTLTDIVNRWWCDTFTGSHENWSMEECIDDLIDQVELFLPKEQSANSQNAYVECSVEGFNDCLNKIRSKLR